MFGKQRGVWGARAVTRADVLTASSAATLLVLFAIPILGGSNGLTVLDGGSTCMANLRELGVGMLLCDAERGFFPTYDDGTSFAADRMMLTWADMLYEKGYVSSTGIQRCPNDPNPGIGETARGERWAFQFVDEFYEGEEPKPGVRGSYGINMILSWGWPEDRYEYAYGQVLAIDAGWSWVGNLNAMWFMAPRVGLELDPVESPNWEPTADWGRHAYDSANLLTLDGGVRRLVPHVPTDQAQLAYAVDTFSAFTWLPGERNTRYDYSTYQGSVAEWKSRQPAMTSSGATWAKHPDLPDDLDLTKYSNNRLWTRLPNTGERFSPYRRGDANCDGAINAFDIDPFVQALTDPDGYAANYPDCPAPITDVNNDGAADPFDIDPFVQRLVGR